MIYIFLDVPLPGLDAILSMSTEVKQAFPETPLTTQRNNKNHTRALAQPSVPQTSRESSSIPRASQVLQPDKSSYKREISSCCRGSRGVCEDDRTTESQTT